jgi:hypothetical protein
MVSAIAATRKRTTACTRAVANRLLNFVDVVSERVESILDRVRCVLLAILLDHLGDAQSLVDRGDRRVERADA